MKTFTLISLLLLGISSLIAQENTTSPKPPDSLRDQFDSIDAWDFGVVKKTVVSTDGVSPVFSPNCDKLAYVEPSWEKGPKTIIVKSLPELKIEKFFKLNGGKNGIAWSPNGKRIVSIDADYGKVTVLDVETEKQFELPDVHISDYYVFWLTDELVSTYYAGGVNLDTLKTAGSSSGAIYEALNRSRHSKLRLGFTSDDSFQTEVFVCSKKRDYRKLLIDKANLTYHSWSSDSRYIARTEEVSSPVDRKWRGQLYLLTLGRTTSAPIDFVVEDFRGTDNPKAEFETFLSKGQPITAEVYAPKKNPLTDKVVGATGDKKADGEIQLRGGRLIFCTTNQRVPINEGDVVRRIMWWSPNRGSGGEISEGIWAVLGKAATDSSSAAQVVAPSDEHQELAQNVARKASESKVQNFPSPAGTWSGTLRNTGNDQGVAGGSAGNFSLVINPDMKTGTYSFQGRDFPVEIAQQENTVTISGNRGTLKIKMVVEAGGKKASIHSRLDPKPGRWAEAEGVFTRQ